MSTRQDRSVSRRTALVGVGVGGVGFVMAARGLSAVAQEATPVGRVGVTTEILGSGQPDAAPGQTLSGRRTTYAPGGFTPAHHHPGALIVHVESGELTYTVIEGNVQVQRATTAGTPGPTEGLGPGQETVLFAGDWVFEQGVVHSVRNDGSDPTVALVTALTATDEPYTVFH